MTNEFNPHSPQSEGQPGSLGNSFGGYMPDMPEGSWERLNKRRKKRRRGFLWWLFPALLLSVGAYWLIQKDKSAEEMLTKSEPPTHVSKEISSARTSDPNADKNTEAKIAEPTERKQPPGISGESERSINPQSESSDNQTSSDPTSKGKLNGVPQFEKSTERPMASNIFFQPTKKKRTMKQTETKSGLEIVKSSSNFSEKEATRNQLASSDFRSESIAQTTKKESASSPVSSKQLNSGVEEVIAQKPGKSENEISGRMPFTEGRKSEETNFVAKAVLPKDGNELESGSVLPPKVDSILDPTNASKDSVRRELTKRKLGFELGLSGLYIQQQLSVQSAAQTGAEQVLQSPVSLRPVLGGNLQFKLKVSIGAKCFLLPLLETSVLHQRMTFQKEPGASAPVKLIQTADGIVGAPVLQPVTYSKETVYLLPGAGLEAGYSWTNSFELRAGAIWSWVFTNGQEEKPQLIQPGYWLAAQYRLQKGWSIRTEIRRMEMSARILSSASSNSRNLILGFGFVRSW